MGFFKDINKLQKQAKEIDKTWDPGQQARDGVEKMKQMNAQMASANAAMTAPPEDGVAATAQIVSVGTTAGMMNMDPIMPIDFLITQQGLPPRPMSASIIVPMAHMAKVQAGVELPVKISKSNPSAIAVDWAAVT